METPQTTSKSNSRPSRTVLMVASLAVLAPLSYVAGRISTATLAHTYLAYLGSGLALGATGAMFGIPIGIFFGSIKSRPGKPSEAAPANTVQMQRDILTTLREELTQDQALFQARQGNAQMYARIDYIMAFWKSIMASGRLFVMQDAGLLNTIALAYYWLEQATHLEKLAYQAKYTGEDADSAVIAARLIAEARLLDGQISNSVTAAISAIDSALV